MKQQVDELLALGRLDQQEAENSGNVPTAVVFLPALPVDYAARVDAIKFALQTMPNDRMRDAAEVINRAEIIHRFLINLNP